MIASITLCMWVFNVKKSSWLTTKLAKVEHIIIEKKKNFSYEHNSMIVINYCAQMWNFIANKSGDWRLHYSKQLKNNNSIWEPKKSIDYQKNFKYFKSMLEKQTSTVRLKFNEHWNSSVNRWHTIWFRRHRCCFDFAQILFIEFPFKFNQTKTITKRTEFF